MKIININEKVKDLIKEYPELNKLNMILNYYNNEMSLKELLNINEIDIGELKIKFNDVEFVDNLSNNALKLKDYLIRLRDKDEIENVRNEFVKEFVNASYMDVMNAEQELISDGMSINEVEKLCDIHSLLFHDEENNYIKENKDILALEKGHPVYTLKLENEKIIEFIDNCLKNNRYDNLNDFIMDLGVHYSKKGDLIYPLLKGKYGFNGPHDVMWGVDDDIRDSLKKLNKNNDSFYSDVVNIFNRIKEMVYKENNILFPTCVDKFSLEDWLNIYYDSLDYRCIFNVNNKWDAVADREIKEVRYDNEVIFNTGRLNINEINAIFNTIPIEITFVDCNDTNKYFNSGKKVFKRPFMSLGRSVMLCHPPKVSKMVEGIINDFKNNKKDNVSIILKKDNNDYLVSYFAVRDNNKYLGTLEVVEEISSLKKYYNI